MIITSRITHRGEERLKLEFPYNTSIANQIKKINKAAWSQTHKAWHIPYTEEALRELKTMFPETDLPIIQVSIPIANETGRSIDITSDTKSKEQITYYNRNHIKVEVIGKKIIMKLPKNEADIRFINSIKYSRWDGRMFCWEIPNYPGNLDLIKSYFVERIDELVEHEKFDVSIHTETYTMGNNELLIIKTRTGRLRLIFGYQNALRLLIKRFPYCSWDAKNKWWTIPYSEIFLNQVQAQALEVGMKVTYEEEPATSAGVKRMSAYDVPNYRECPGEMILKLRELRYSEKTIKTY
jgi:hypothetical protein